MSLQYKFIAEDLISDERIKRENVEIIEKWIQNSNEKFIPKEIPREMIVLFLLSCEDDVDATKNTVTSYFTLKKNSPELYDCRNAYAEEIDLLMKMWTIVTLPTRTKENYVIHYFRLEDEDYKKFDTVGILRSTIMLMDVSLDNKNPPDGLIVVLDMELAGLRHLTKLNIDLCRKYFNFIQEALPIKLRAIHYMNSNFVLNKLFGLIKGLIKNDVFDKMHFHSHLLTMKEFYKFIPKECLPKDFGGDLSCLKDLHNITHRQFKDKQDFWETEEKLRKSVNTN